MPIIDNPYAECPIYLEHGACQCSTGYPANCVGDSLKRGIDDAIAGRVVDLGDLTEEQS